ncbi:hypothetical protein KIK84_08310 [Curvibacter sp. CHRR-16]|uniref:hypothetical protein n=1 Tax=Curvibacter sp. CHRR-16 TaxID=2835872 RepID=UPI001BD9FB12|nr:hypothetical protein [Curvibacter sp. CHRR-16]MBT0570327.1 hypothetical protein [Curvibacter sp. CHRR-16]
MSLFNWFGKKANTATPTTQRTNAGLQADGARAGAVGADANDPLARRAERYERREMLYGVVRETMARAGLISSSYKFKVLSLDSRGLDYLVMVDVGSAIMADHGRLYEMEQNIVQAAKNRHEMQVNAVYWRANEHVLAQRITRTERVAQEPADSRKSTATDERAFADTTSLKPYDPLHEDELLAFKKALASIPAQGPLSAPGQIVQTGPRKPMPVRDFQDTVIDERAMSPLSSTQWGDL